MNKFTSDFEINDYSIAIRNILTKGQVHEEIANLSGATLSTRGRFVPPDLKSPMNRDRPLYLFVQANTQEKVDKAIKAIVDRVNYEESKFNKLNNKSNFSKNLTHLQNTVAKLPIMLDAPLAFDLRNRVIGVQGTNLNYIQTETGATVTLRGKGSSFVDPTTQTESNEPLHLYIEHANSENLQEAKILARNLIETIQQDLALFRTQNQNKSNNQVQQSNTNPQITIPSFPPPSLIQQQNFIQQAPPTIIQQQPTTNTIIQQQPTTTTFHSVPMQIIQQTPITIPPPTIPIRTQPIVQLQQPTNIQIQGTNGQQAQILVNQPPQQYQLQYIQPNQQSQQTIQHFIQPQQQIQGIIQTTPIQQQNAQQIITLQSLQGNAFMIPPPNIIAQQPQNIIQTGDINLNATDVMKDDKEKDDVIRSDNKNDGNQQIHVATTRAILTTPMTITNIPPIMTVPPPNIQQIIGNTLITQPPPTQTQTQPQIFNQIPVSIQQQPQQVQVSGGFIVQNQPWQPNQQQSPQTQQLTQLNPIQQIRNSNEIIINNVQGDFRTQPPQQTQQQQIIQTFNPQQMQIQFHPPPQIIQQQTSQPMMEQQTQQQVIAPPNPPPIPQNQNFQQQGGFAMYNKPSQNEQQRLAHKRKHPVDSDDDKNNQPHHKSGIGCSPSNSFGSCNNNNNSNQIGGANSGSGGPSSGGQMAVGGNNNSNNNNGCGGINNNSNRQQNTFNKNQKNNNSNAMRMNVNNNFKNNSHNYNSNKFNNKNNNNNINESQQRNMSASVAGGSSGNNCNTAGNLKNDKPPLPGEQVINDEGRNGRNMPMNEMMGQQRPEQMMRGNMNQNFRFGPPPNNFMPGPHQNVPPPHPPNFNQNRGSVNPPGGGFHQQQQQQSNQFMHQNQMQRPMMQDMNNPPFGNNNFNNNNNNSNYGPRFNFGPPPGFNQQQPNGSNFQNQHNNGPRFRQQW